MGARAPIAVTIATAALAGGCATDPEPPAIAARPASVCGPSPAERPAAAVLGAGARGLVYGEGRVTVRFVTTPLAAGRPPRVPLGRNGVVKLSVIVRPGYDGLLKLRIAPVGERTIARFVDSGDSETTIPVTRVGNGVRPLGLLLPAEGCYRLLLVRPGVEPEPLFFRAT